ncbi:MAG: 3-hydroxyacyl-CoA dehydrogenase [Gammaproteobacteria bacterium]|nr:3-hydroxyacyl-CoA dehydrogenase [Gammaproteobacteria bacterium]
MRHNDQTADVLVIGAGVMGSGIAQVAAQAGHRVSLYDSRAGAAADAHERLAATLAGLVERGKLTGDEVTATVERITPIAELTAAGDAGIAIEAIVEDREAKNRLFVQLERILPADALLASNTSSLSIDAIARGMTQPERLVGMHFFNPVPLMRLVEVVSGLQTDSDSAARVFALAGHWGKTAVHARSTPGFIVNRIARPFYAEALNLLQERAAEAAEIDACLRGAGFRMGPCELMDLIGHDVNFAVTRSVFEANFFDKRYQPSLVQQALVEAGHLGRKSGRGFYDYPAAGAGDTSGFRPPDAPPSRDNIGVRGQGPVAEHMAAILQQHNCRFERINDSKWIGLQVDSARLRLTDGRTAAELGRDIAVFDLPLVHEPGSALAWSHAERASANWVEQAPRWLALFGFAPQQVEDTPGLVVARTLAMLINEAADAVQQGVCSEVDANRAMCLGVNYPAGPFEWLASWGPAAVIRLVDALDAAYRGERYRVSPWLRQRAWSDTGGHA